MNGIIDKEQDVHGVNGDGDGDKVAINDINNDKKEEVDVNKKDGDVDIVAKEKDVGKKEKDVGNDAVKDVEGKDDAAVKEKDDVVKDEKDESVKKDDAKDKKKSGGIGCPYTFTKNFLKSPTGIKIIDIIMWKDIKWSLMIFGFGLLFPILMKFCNILYLLSSLVFLHLVVCLMYVNGMKLWTKYVKNNDLKKGKKDDDVVPMKVYITKESIEKFAFIVSHVINALANRMVVLYRCKDNKKTAVLLVKLFIFMTFAKIFSIPTIYMMLNLIIFIVPVVYTKQKELIDTYIVMLKSSIVQQLQGIRGKLPAALQGFIPSKEKNE